MVGDIILACDGKTGLQTLLDLVTMCKKEAGEKTVFEVLRGDRKMTFTVIAAPRGK